MYQDRHRSVIFRHTSERTGLVLHLTRNRMRQVAVFAGVIALTLLTVLGFLPAQATAASNSGDGIGSPQFAKESLNTSVQHSATTIPNWSSSFTYNGTTYPYTMVGTNPASGSASSTIPTEIIPLSFTFSNGVTLDGTTKVQSTIASPIFQSAAFKSGTTQYGDAIQRAEFWNYVSTTSSNYHVLFGQPTVLATESIAVPSNQGTELTGSSSHRQIGLIDYSWFSSHLKNLLGSLHISSQVMPIFLTYNTFLYQGSTSNCCIIGYHGATSSTNGNGVQQVNTYIFAAYNDPGIFGVPIEDINGLSHEESEWLNDPFTNNVVPAWTVPSEPQYGCSNALETGDPLVGVAFTVNGYHPQDEAFLSWFARQTPSTSIDQLYTYLGTFTSYSPSC